VSPPTLARLRPVEDDDHEWLVALHNDPVVLRNLTHPQPITLGHHYAWWEKTKHDHRQLRLVFEADGRRVGFAKFYDIDQANRCCTLGGDIHELYRGQGYAKHMWALMLDRCFDGMQLHRVGLTTAEFNEVAQRVYRKLGFREEGRLTQSLLRDGVFYDQVMMFMLREDWQQEASHDR
jgi:RimJ/RimL family protein N-acetyltransferase